MCLDRVEYCETINITILSRITYSYSCSCVVLDLSLVCNGRNRPNNSHHRIHPFLPAQQCCFSH